MISDFFHDKTVLITGAAGFIGSHLTERVLNLGGKVIAVDNFITGDPKNLQELRNEFAEQLTFIESDVINPPETYLPSQIKIDLVLHFASPASPPRYQAHPIATYQVNAFATHHLLEFLRKKYSKSRFLFASTSEIYGDPLIHPQTEDYWGNVNPNGLRSCYDEAKRMGETICGVFHRDYEMDVRIVRIFNTYGPRMDATDGRIIPNLVNQALQGENLTIYGDGQQTRSYCYVDDLVEGILRFAALENLQGETINLGNPDELSILATAEIISDQVNQILGKSEKLKITHLPLPQDDPKQRQPDISKAKKQLNWQPQVNFEEGLRKTIKYFYGLT